MKTLIAYFSWFNNPKKLVEEISRYINITIYETIFVILYTKEALNYMKLK